MDLAVPTWAGPPAPPAGNGAATPRSAAGGSGAAANTEECYPRLEGALWTSLGAELREMRRDAPGHLEQGVRPIRGCRRGPGSATLLSPTFCTDTVPRHLAEFHILVAKSVGVGRSIQRDVINYPSPCRVLGSVCLFSAEHKAVLLRLCWCSPPPPPSPARRTETNR